MPDSAALGADDLVPLFIFVLCQSGLQTPLRDKDLLWALCHPDQLYGEAGYFLTVYESACAFVEAFDEADAAGLGPRPGPGPGLGLGPGLGQGDSAGATAEAEA